MAQHNIIADTCSSSKPEHPFPTVLCIWRYQQNHYLQEQGLSLMSRSFFRMWFYSSCHHQYTRHWSCSIMLLYYIFIYQSKYQHLIYVPMKIFFSTNNPIKNFQNSVSTKRKANNLRSEIFFSWCHFSPITFFWFLEPQ